MTIPLRIRLALREHLVGFTLAEIDNLFQAEGFSPGQAGVEVSGQRRNRVEEYYATINWQSSVDTRRFLRVVEETLAQTLPDHRSNLEGVLRRSGFTIDESGRVGSNADATLIHLAGSSLPSGVQHQIDRIWDSLMEDPEEAIGAAKELIEATTKHVLDALDLEYVADADVPALIKAAQKALRVHPEAVSPDKKGLEVITMALGNLSQVAVRVAELRNLYGTGHGRPRRITGLRPRHARLAVGAAATYCGFLLDTLNDPEAPWKACSDITGPTQ